jgi:NADH:ubiquinone oxidoreductase subunit D
MRWAGYVARMEEMRNSYRILVGKLEGLKHRGSTTLHGATTPPQNANSIFTAMKTSNVTNQQ